VYNLSTIVRFDCEAEQQDLGTGYFDDDGILYFVNQNALEQSLVKCPAARNNIRSYNVKDGTTVIYNNAFQNKSNLTEVYFPETVYAIGTNAFNGCINLKAAYFSGNAPTTITAGGNNNQSFKADTVTLYYISGKSDWTPTTWNGYNTAVWKSVDLQNMQHGYFRFETDTVEPKQNCDWTSDYYYSDDYFKTSAYEYNNSLATMSMCLELSTWASPRFSGWYNRSVTPDKEAFYQDKLVNVKTLLLGNPFEIAKYSATDVDGSIAMLNKGLGFDHFSANEFWESEPTTSSIGVCAARKQIQDASGETYTLVALVIRGGTYGKEWASNFLVNRGIVHSGFSEAQINVIEWLETYMGSFGSKFGTNESDKIKLWCVGYSRGAAVANMVCGWLDDRLDYFYGKTLTKENIYCYTFETPKGVAKQYNTGAYNNIHNSIYFNDVVPLVALQQWGFYRYNYENDYYYPNARLNSEAYNKLIGSVKKNLKELQTSKSVLDYYGVHTYLSDTKDYTAVLGDDLEVKYVILENGELKLATRTREQYGILLCGIDYLSTVISKDQYVSDYQNLVTKFFEDMNGDGLEEYNRIIERFIVMLNEEDHPFLEWLLKNVVIKSWLTSPDNDVFNTENVVKVAKYKIEKDYINEYYRRYGEGDRQLIEAIQSLAYMVVDDVVEDVMSHSLYSLNTIAEFVQYILTIKGDAHIPFVSLAWLRALDPNYGCEYEYKQNKLMRIYRINCPVNVYAYNGENEILRIENDEISGTGDVYAYINENNEKIVYLPSDSAYRIEVVPYDNGVLNISVAECNPLTDQNVRLENYYDIEIKEGDVVSLDVPEIREEDVTSYDDGSTVDYTVSFNGSGISSDETYSGADEIEELLYSVTINVEGAEGYASGAGKYTAGSFAQLSAACPHGRTFKGWYSGDELLSEEETFRFAVRSDTVITARFELNDSFMLGDVNSDSIVDYLDLTILSRALSGWNNYFLEIDPAAANLNGDDTIDARDRMILSRYLAGWPGYAEIVDR
jgi:hypothetical protein